MRRPVSFAFLKQMSASIAPRAQSLPNATSEELPSINSFKSVIASRSLSTHENGRVLPVPLVDYQYHPRVYSTKIQVKSIEGKLPDSMLRLTVDQRQ